MNTNTNAPRWTRVMNGWYSLNLVTATSYDSLEILKTSGLWAVTVNDVKVGLVETLAGAKRVALASL